ncbi:MEDS domain-containing protein [Micromonospora sp. H33]|uniref:MEDS domain-containing protein n=1 Tax=Micromonospora sp. H33 TaxID=3452215 RepID=UPI003F8C017F
MTTGAVVGQVDLGDHICWTYDVETAGLDAVGRFVAAGLLRDEKVVCFLDTLDPAAVVAAVHERGAAPEEALADGRLRIRPATESYRPDGRLDPDRMVFSLADESARAQREGHVGLRLVGDMSWAARTGTDVAELCRYEASVNRLFPDGRVAALCLYDRRLFPADDLWTVAATHPSTVGPRTGRTWIPLLRAYRTGQPPGLRLVGQVDVSNRAAFAAMVTDATDRLPFGRAVVLDLSGVSFADVAAATALVDAGRAARPREVRLVGCRPPLRRLLDLVGAEVRA